MKLTLLFENMRWYRLYQHLYTAFTRLSCVVGVGFTSQPKFLTYNTSKKKSIVYKMTRTTLATMFL